MPRTPESKATGSIRIRSVQDLINRARRVLAHPRCEHNVSDAFESALSAYSEMDAARLIAFLARRPGIPFLAEDLVLWLDSGCHAVIRAAGEVSELETPVPLSDGRTLREVNRRLSTLKGLLAMRRAVGHETARVEAEIVFLKNYLNECSRPGGIIRAARRDDRRHYQRLQAAVKRLLSKLRGTHPHCHARIKSHLSMGRIFIWEKDVPQS